jgi:hypothetical protein
LDKVDTFVNSRVSGDPVEKVELVQAEPKCDANGGIELFSAAIVIDHAVEVDLMPQRS